VGLNRLIASSSPPHLIERFFFARSTRRNGKNLQFVEIKLQCVVSFDELFRR
jgi:hypothetical protein